MAKKMVCTASAVVALAIVPQVWAAPPPPIPKGDIAINLVPIATQLGAPDYGISPPGDLSRLFVVEQKGLLRVIQNGSLLPGSVLDITTRVSPPLVPSNPNDERGFLGLAFSPGFNDSNSVGYRTLYTYTSEPLPAGTLPTYVTPNYPSNPMATQNFKNVITEWKMSATNPNLVDLNSRRELISFGKTANNHNGGTIAFGPDGNLTWGRGTAATPGTSARAISSQAAMRRT